VILGNPPYNAFAGVSPQEEQGLVEPYKEGLISRWGIKKFNLDELYVRFFRLAERRIAEKTGKGVVCYISNFSYLGDPSFVVMRQRLLSEFDALWFDCLNGDSRETGKVTPEGKPDPSVFSTEYNREGIRVGTAIGLMVRQEQHRGAPTARFRHFWGASKRTDLLESLKALDFNAQYHPVTPDTVNRLSFRPSEVAAHYLKWPSLDDIAIRSFAGIAEDRQKALISIDRSELQHRMKLYFDPNIDWETLEILKTGLTRDVPRFDAKRARETLLKAERYSESRLLPFAMRPLDLQWCYYSPVRPLWREPRPAYWLSYRPGSPALITRFKATKSPEGPAIAFARHLCDYHMMPPNASIFPVSLNQAPAKMVAGQNDLFTEGEGIEASPTANLSAAARTYLATLGLTDPDADPETAGLIWIHALAVGYAPAYLTENADGIRQDWPRVPLPDTAEALRASARLGREIAALLDPETPVPGVTAGTLRPELKVMAVVSRVGGGPLNPDAGDLALTCGWGHGGKDGVTMPGKGKVIRRDYTLEELAAIREGAGNLGLTPEQALEHLGETTFDIYLNETAYWQNVPEKVWTYYIGGYQVMKKWLSYREQKLLGRTLSPEETREVMNMARRLAAIVLMEPALNANYHAVKDSCYPWPQS
jgi:hypothetical protein